MMTKFQNRFAEYSLVIVLVTGFVLGKVFGGTIWVALGGMLWSFICWFIGAVAGHMDCLSDAIAMATESEQRILDADEHQKTEFQRERVLLDLEREQIERSKTRLNGSHYGQVRAVVDRVVNRILTRWVKNLGDNARREMVFKDVEAIMSEEFDRENIGKDVVSPLGG